MSEQFLNELADVLNERKNTDPDSSYTASLYHAGLDKILKKLGEEATETVIASKTGEKDAIIHEVADLWFHSLVLLGYHDLTPDHIIDELKRRFGESGLLEKANRQKK